MAVATAEAVVALAALEDVDAGMAVHDVAAAFVVELQHRVVAPLREVVPLPLVRALDSASARRRPAPRRR